MGQSWGEDAVKRGAGAHPMISGASEAMAHFVEAFGTLVIVVLLGFWAGRASHSLLIGFVVGGLGVVGSLLSLIYRAREGLERSVADAVESAPSAAPHRPGRGRVLEASLELPDELRDAARTLDAPEFGGHTGA